MEGKLTMIAEYAAFIKDYLRDERPYRLLQKPETAITCTLPNGMTLTIRCERKEEWREVEELTRRTFWSKKNMERLGGIGCDEHYLCHVLRGVPEFIPELDLIAIHGERIVGNVMFTAGYVKSTTGERRVVLNFGPLSVLPEYCGIGVGSALLRCAVETARRFGYGGILFFGHPTYYPRLGFADAREFGITTSAGTNFPAFMGMELIPNYLRQLGGGAFFVSPHMEISADDAQVYDVQFPPISAGPEVVPMTALHIPFLHRLMNLSAVREALQEPKTPLSIWNDAFTLWSVDPDEESFILYQDAHPSGWLKLNGLGRDTVWISMLVIHPEARRCGIATQALEYAETYTRSRGLHHLALHTSAANQAAQSLYEACGYIKTAQGEVLTYEKKI